MTVCYRSRWCCFPSPEFNRVPGYLVRVRVFHFQLTSFFPLVFPLFCGLLCRSRECFVYVLLLCAFNDEEKWALVFPAPVLDNDDVLVPAWRRWCGSCSWSSLLLADAFIIGAKRNVSFLVSEMTFVFNKFPRFLYLSLKLYFDSIVFSSRIYSILFCGVAFHCWTLIVWQEKMEILGNCNLKEDGTKVLFT